MAWPGVLKVAFVLTLLALFFITVGYLLPWWFVGPHFHLGVFYGLLCYPGDISSGNCTVFSYYDLKLRDASAATLEGRTQTISSTRKGPPIEMLYANNSQYFNPMTFYYRGTTQYYSPRKGPPR